MPVNVQTMLLYRSSDVHAWHIMLLFNRLIQQSGLNTLVPVYVVGVFTGDKMIAEGKVLVDSTDVCTTFV